MLRLLAFTGFASAALLFPAAADADSIEMRAIKELQEKVEQQSRQLEGMSQQLAKIAQAMEAQKAPAPSSTPAPSAGDAPSDAPAPPTEKAEPPIPKAEAVPAAPRHVVVKGETLTSIAKQYNIPLPELQKLNKIEDGRKMQIGQTLILPHPKPPEAQPEKKENP